MRTIALLATLLLPSVARAELPRRSTGGDIAIGLGGRLAVLTDIAVSPNVTLGGQWSYAFVPDVLRGGAPDSSYLGGGATISLRGEAERNSIPFVTLAGGVAGTWRKVCYSSGLSLFSCDRDEQVHTGIGPLVGATAGWLARPRPAVVLGVSLTFEYAASLVFVGLGFQARVASAGDMKFTPTKRKPRVVNTTTTEPGESYGWPSGP